MLIQTSSAKTTVSALASAAATAVIVRSVLRDYVPPEIQRFFYSKLRYFFANPLISSSDLTLVFEEFVANDNPDGDGGGSGLSHNHLFRAAKTYLNPTELSRKLRTTRFKASLPKKETSLAITMESNQEIVDLFRGVRLTWKFIASSPEASAAAAQNRFELRFHKKHRATVVDAYLPHVIERSKEAEQEAKRLKLFTLRRGGARIIRPMWMAMANMWDQVAFDHPSTFATLAMGPAEKAAVMEDLERFVERRGFYRSVGRAWKRGYLLFGPPGTGKTSLVAAIANYLKFDVYELELSSVRNNAELRKVVISMGNRSVLVVEDIDCAADLGRKPARPAREDFFPPDQRRSEVTLSGLLNFIDGLWSSCGDERIIVLTTNHKDRLDPALLRPGRMDFHIHMSYCTPSSFKMLASNYLGLTEHYLFSDIGKLIETTNVTPAEIGEELLKIEDPESSLTSLIKFLKMKKENGTPGSSTTG